MKMRRVKPKGNDPQRSMQKSSDGGTNVCRNKCWKYLEPGEKPVDRKSKQLLWPPVLVALKMLYSGEPPIINIGKKGMHEIRAKKNGSLMLDPLNIAGMHLHRLSLGRIHLPPFCHRCAHVVDNRNPLLHQKICRITSSMSLSLCGN